jgi:hypothetical protein
MDRFQKEESENEECESEHNKDKLGNYETEKLISAITKSLTFFENVGEWQVQILSAQTWQEPREVKPLYLTLAYREDLCMLVLHLMLAILFSSMLLFYMRYQLTMSAASISTNLFNHYSFFSTLKFFNAIIINLLSSTLALFFSLFTLRMIVNALSLLIS